MSSYQPPGGPQPDAGPPYVPPQDPWQGVASVPTDPIPYSQYGQHTGPWSQQTAIVGGPGYEYQQQQRSRVGLFVLVFLLVLVLGGGGGLATWWVVSNHNNENPTTLPSSSSTANPTATATGAPTSCALPSGQNPFDPCAVKVNDCILNLGTQASPDVQFVACSTAGSYKVIKLQRGPNIPKNSAGKYDRDVTSVAVCKDTAYEAWYGYKDARDNRRDVFLCLIRN